jgi:site-specific recombinase XerD
MTTQLRKLLGTDQVGTATLHLLSSSLAPTTYANYDSGVRQFAAFCHEEDIHPLQATTQSIVRYTAWLGLQGTVAAASLQHYYSAINKFFRDHQQQPIAVGELLADARRGLEI